MGRVSGSQGTWDSLHFENVLKAGAFIRVTSNLFPPQDCRGPSVVAVANGGVSVCTLATVRCHATAGPGNHQPNSR
jgi:hypothetical protein